MKPPRHGKPGSERGTMFDSEGAIPKGNPHQFDFGRSVRPHCAVFGPKDGLLYVTSL
jgi:hypothetical protein